MKTYILSTGDLHPSSRAVLRAFNFEMRSCKLVLELVTRSSN